MRDMTTLPEIDLSDLHVEDIEVLVQEGSQGMPEFAASSCDTCNCGTCSCGGGGGTKDPEIEG